MSDQDDRHTLSIQIANQIINMANNRLQEGMHPADIAAGMRHAAANFSAFAMVQTGAASGDLHDVDPVPLAEEFLQIFAYYFEKHGQQQAPSSGLDALIKQVRDET